MTWHPKGLINILPGWTTWTYVHRTLKTRPTPYDLQCWALGVEFRQKIIEVSLHRAPNSFSLIFLGNITPICSWKLQSSALLPETHFIWTNSTFLPQTVDPKCIFLLEKRIRLKICFSFTSAPRCLEKCNLLFHASRSIDERAQLVTNPKFRLNMDSCRKIGSN